MTKHGLFDMAYLKAWEALRFPALREAAIFGKKTFFGLKNQPGQQGKLCSFLKISEVDFFQNKEKVFRKLLRGEVIPVWPLSCSPSCDRPTMSFGTGRSGFAASNVSKKLGQLTRIWVDLRFVSEGAKTVQELEPQNGMLEHRFNVI